MKTENAFQFLSKNKHLKYIRVFFNVQMIYGNVFHYAMYLQIDKNKDESLFRAFNYIENHNQMNINYKYVVVGYDKILDATQILTFLNNKIDINICDDNITFFIEQL